MIELTNECQLQCITCPRDKAFASDYRIGRMSKHDFQHVFDQFAPRLEVLDLTGLGESLTHPEFFDIVRYVRDQRHLHLYLTTNTILLTDRIVAQLHETPVNTLCISIDGTSQEEYAAVRGPLNFAKLKARVRKAVSRLAERMEFILCVVLVHGNMDSMLRFVDLAAELEIRRLSLKPMNLVGNELPTDYYLPFRTPRFNELSTAAVEHGNALGVEVNVFRIGSYQCMFPWEPIYVTWDGYVVPCCAKPFPNVMNFGNLLEEDWASIRNSAPFVDFRRHLLRGRRAPSFCNKCHIMDKTLFQSGLPILQIL
ncbi:MAG: radical SAM protein [Gemmatimonadota bacterium]|nr:radical SAM protein [Gemmatimonadota bacterium]